MFFYFIFWFASEIFLKTTDMSPEQSDSFWVKADNARPIQFEMEIYNFVTNFVQWLIEGTLFPSQKKLQKKED